MPKHLVAIAVLALMPIYADAAPAPVRMQWDGLSTLIGKTVRIAMPGGTVITGSATGMEPDALLVNVKSTSVEVVN